MMIRMTCALLFCLPLVAVGCSSSGSPDVTANASEEDIANYERLIAEANGEVEAEDREGAFDE